MNVESGAQGNLEISMGSSVACLGQRWGSPTLQCAQFSESRRIFWTFHHPWEEALKAGVCAVPQLQRARPEEEVGDVTSSKANGRQGSHLQVRRRREQSDPQENSV